MFTGYYFIDLRSLAASPREEKASTLQKVAVCLLPRSAFGELIAGIYELSSANYKVANMLRP